MFAGEFVEAVLGLKLTLAPEKSSPEKVDASTL